MRQQHRLTPIRPFALAATAAMIAAALALAWGAGAAHAGPLFSEVETPMDPAGPFFMWFEPFANECVSPTCGGWAATTGNSNVAVGAVAMPTPTTGSSNVALDHGANGELTTGNNNIAIGVSANLKNKQGNDNIAIGTKALEANTGKDNIASGTEALFSNTEGSGNIASGVNALHSNTAGLFNIASGFDALRSNTTGGENIASGVEAMHSNETGGENIASGAHVLFSNTSGSRNIASGFAALSANTEGNDNIALGFNALFKATGSSNVAIGSFAGGELTTGSNNIEIAHEGLAADEATTRIGTEGKQTRAFVAGVYEKALAGAACNVRVNSEGQLGCGAVATPASTAIATFASFGGVGSEHCLRYTEIAGQGQDPCPPATSGFTNSNVLAGPTPANGAAVTNLYADSNATVSGTDTVLVAVIDNTTGATKLSCTVNSTTKNHCSNSSGSGSVAAGDNIEVKVTATPSNGSGNNKSWRVRFRY